MEQGNSRHRQLYARLFDSVYAGMCKFRKSWEILFRATWSSTWHKAHTLAYQFRFVCRESAIGSKIVFCVWLLIQLLRVTLFFSGRHGPGSYRYRKDEISPISSLEFLVHWWALMNPQAYKKKGRTFWKYISKFSRIWLLKMHTLCSWGLLWNIILIPHTCEADRESSHNEDAL